MKSKWTPSFLGCLLSATVFTTAYSQEMLSVSLHEISFTRDKAAFAYTTNLHDLESMNTKNLKTATVSEKVVHAFSTTFSNAAKAQWYAYDKKGKVFLVTFTNGERECSALFTKRAKMFYSITSGSEKDLSADTRKYIKAWYTDYAIIGLVEISLYYRTYFLINLKRGNDLVVLRMEDDSIEEFGYYKFQSGNEAPKQKPKKQDHKLIAAF